MPANPENVITRSPEPLFIILNVFVTISPTITTPKSREVGATEMSGVVAGRAAVNEMSIVGVSGSFEVIFKVAVFNPADVGVNRTFRL